MSGVCVCLERPQRGQAGHQDQAQRVDSRGGGHIGGAPRVPGLHDGGRGGRGQHRALGQRDVRVKCGQDTCDTSDISDQRIMFILSPRTMGVIPTIENLYQIIVIVLGPREASIRQATVCSLFGRWERGRTVRWFTEKEFIFVAN